jgi:acetylornithine aminotransferase/acetylornithine/N-succinyldiaminopimelate aminotransferase
MVDLPIRNEATKALADFCPEPLKRIFFVNSGSEANENAIKIARKVTARPYVLAFEGGFHGRTLGALAVTGIGRYRELAAPLLRQSLFAPFGDLEAVRALLESKPVAAIIIEPIQSMAGCRTTGEAFFCGLRRLCDEHQSLLIFDEIQTGMGRCGRPFFAGSHGIVPDIMTLGKGLASGIPMGAVVTSAQLAAKVAYGDLGTTFGGGPMAAAALKATLDVLGDERLCQNAAVMGAYLKEGIQIMPRVLKVDGDGLLLGITLDGGAKPVQEGLLKRGVIAGLAESPSILRLMPPLTITAAECDTFLDAFGGALGGQESGHAG